MPSVFETLGQRGFIAECSSPDLPGLLAREQVAMYVGFDPSADSLQAGNLVPIMAMAHFQRAGHRVLALIGGATGMVGDPSGKSEERNLLTADEVAANAATFKQQMRGFLDFEGSGAAVMLDNHDWIGPMSFLDWLRDVGKHFTVNVMLAKESVKSRLGTDAGISYTEFSYMTLQAYDFLHLYNEYGCRLQCGGNDQWGNITAGIDLVRRARGAEVYGLTFPLVTTATGEKFGKSAGNAVWLDAQRTSPYAFYQYWVRTDDRDVERYLKLFTFLELDRIDEIYRAHEAAPERREGQRTLAAELTRIVHGDDDLRRAEQASRVLFGGEVAGLADADLGAIFADVPSLALPRQQLDAGIGLLDLFKRSGLCKSTNEARRLVKSGGAYVNNVRVADAEARLGPDALASESMIVLRGGKKSYCLVRCE